MVSQPCLASTSRGLNKMHTTHSATPAQNLSKQGNGLVLVGLLSLGAFLLYAVENHLITDTFMAFMSLFFDTFSVKSNSIFPDLALLILFSLAVFGLYSLIKSFFAVTLAIVIIAVVVWIVLSADTVTRHEIKAKSAFPSLENVWGG